MTYVNPSFLKMWGFDDPQKILGKLFWRFWLVEDRIDEIMKALRSNGLWFNEVKAKRKGGAIFWVQVSSATVFDKKGNPKLIRRRPDLSDLF
jgi:two-component system cell cycle sensor histidine kinase/response regulator CckA